MALLANAPERLPERKKRPRDGPSEFRPAAAPLGSGTVKPTSRGAKHRVMSQREEQLAVQRVGNEMSKIPLMLFFPSWCAAGDGEKQLLALLERS